MTGPLSIVLEHSLTFDRRNYIPDGPGGGDGSGAESGWCGDNEAPS